MNNEQQTVDSFSYNRNNTVVRLRDDARGAERQAQVEVERAVGHRDRATANNATADRAGCDGKARRVERPELRIHEGGKARDNGGHTLDHIGVRHAGTAGNTGRLRHDEHGGDKRVHA